MIDYFALALTHLLLAVAFYRLARRDDIDPAPVDRRPIGGVAADSDPGDPPQ